MRTSIVLPLDSWTALQLWGNMWTFTWRQDSFSHSENDGESPMGDLARTVSSHWGLSRGSFRGKMSCIWTSCNGRSSSESINIRIPWCPFFSPLSPWCLNFDPYFGDGHFEWIRTLCYSWLSSIADFKLFDNLRLSSIRDLWSCIMDLLTFRTYWR